MGVGRGEHVAVEREFRVGRRYGWGMGAWTLKVGASVGFDGLIGTSGGRLSLLPETRK